MQKITNLKVDLYGTPEGTFSFLYLSEIKTR